MSQLESSKPSGVTLPPKQDIATHKPSLHNDADLQEKSSDTGTLKVTHMMCIMCSQLTLRLRRASKQSGALMTPVRHSVGLLLALSGLHAFCPQALRAQYRPPPPFPPPPSLPSKLKHRHSRPVPTRQCRS